MSLREQCGSGTVTDQGHQGGHRQTPPIFLLKPNQSNKIVNSYEMCPGCDVPCCAGRVYLDSEDAGYPDGAADALQTERCHVRVVTVLQAHAEGCQEGRPCQLRRTRERSIRRTRMKTHKEEKEGRQNKWCEFGLPRNKSSNMKQHSHHSHTPRVASEVRKITEKHINTAEISVQIDEKNMNEEISVWTNQ